MFGWFATPSTPRCALPSQAVMSCRVQRTSSHHFMRKLPALGSVLYLHDASAQRMTDASPYRVLVADHALTPLQDVCWLMAISAVTEDGPREWLECMDRRGHLRARLHLLPDTDYLAWEALTWCELPLQSPISPATPQFRPDTASVISFRWRELAGMAMLERNEAESLSALGARVAADIARAEFVSL